MGNALADHALVLLAIGTIQRWVDAIKKNFNYQINYFYAD